MLKYMQMKIFEWNNGKNDRLRRERGVSFEAVVLHIERGDILEVVRHPRQDKYPGQKIFVIAIGGYAYLVPFVEDGETIFLKTIVPSRKATRKYLGGGEYEAE